MEEIIPPMIEEMSVFGSGIFNEHDMLSYEIKIANVSLVLLKIILNLTKLTLGRQLSGSSDR